MLLLVCVVPPLSLQQTLPTPSMRNLRLQSRRRKTPNDAAKAEHGNPGLQKTAGVPENVKQSRKRETPAEEEATPSKTFRTEDTEDSQVTRSTAANNFYIDLLSSLTTLSVSSVRAPMSVSGVDACLSLKFAWYG